MEEAGLDALLVFGNAGDPGDLVYLSNFIPFGRQPSWSSRSTGSRTIVTDAVLHGEPINSYAWMTWVEDFRRRPSLTEGVRRRHLEVPPEGQERRRVGLVGRDNSRCRSGRSWRARARVDWVDFLVRVHLGQEHQEPKGGRAAPGSGTHHGCTPCRPRSSR